MINDFREKRPDYVQNVFSRIAGKYDIMNRLMTGGMDLSWRKKVIKNAHLQPGCKLLDLGSGTGDLAREASHTHPGINITAADFTLGMMLTGKNWERIQRCNADALNLPFQNEHFDVIISGFLMRNVVSVEQALCEKYRVLKPGGRVVILDTTRPRKNFFSPFIRIYLDKIIPFIGTLITGQKDAYSYLPDSTQNFLQAEALAQKITSAGFQMEKFEILMFGTIAIHTANKPEK